MSSTANQHNPLLTAALEHARAGRAVFPCHHVTGGDRCSCGKGVQCGNPGKHPRWDKKDLPNGCLSATTEEEQIRTWWRRWPQANIGIATGAKSGFWALDVDPRHGGDETLAELEAAHGRLPNTVEAVTGGGGRHLLFRYVEGIPNEVGQKDCARLGVGLDTRSDGGLIIGAGSIHQSGRTYEWELSSHPDEVELATAPEWLVHLLTRNPISSTGRAASEPVPPIIPEGARDNTLYKAACSMRAKGFAQPEIEAALLVMNRERCRPPLEDDVVRKKAASACRYKAGELFAVMWRAGEHTDADAPPATAEKTEPQEVVDLARELEKYHDTEWGNAQRLIRRYGPNLRFWVERGQYLVWNSQYWETDDTGAAVRLAKETVRRLFEELQITDRREDKFKWLIKSETAGQIGAMLRLARTEPGVPIQADDLDRDPWLFNVANGTVDLRTGHLRPHRREDLITQCAPVAYDPDVTCPFWEGFLQRAMDGDAEMISYLQRVTGCVLAGQPADRVFWFFYGSGGNGKSTFTDLLHALMGPYAKKTAAETLLAKPGGDGIPNDLADLKGARLVTSAELSEARRLNEARIKDLTGRDIIKARFMRQEFFEFLPTFKLFMYGNHRPLIRGTDDGIWDRVKLVPFTVTIPDREKDEHLPAKLRAELPGILNWAVQGCLEWQRSGLRHPEKVQAATQRYRQQQDPLEDFLADRCILGARCEVRNPHLWAAYEDWCKTNGEAHPLGRKTFSEKLEQRGFTQKKSGDRWWVGLGLVERHVEDSTARPAQDSTVQFPSAEVSKNGRHSDTWKAQLGTIQARNGQMDTSGQRFPVNGYMGDAKGLTGNSCPQVPKCPNAAETVGVASCDGGEPPADGGNYGGFTRPWEVGA